MAIELCSPDGLDAEDQAAVRGLAAAVEADDGQPPLSDQALTHLGAASARHVVAHDADRLVGYAQLDGRSLEIAASTDVLEPLLDEFDGQALLVWSHGRRSRLAAVLGQRGFAQVRTLHQLRRSLDDPLPERALPSGIEIRAFVIGRDEDDWTRVNAAAFAHHPEQANWARTDLEAREAETWFDPSGFLLAWRGADLVGFHWTKLHEDHVGEVYVIGIDPSAQGGGLGAVLLQRGLTYLRDRECSQVLLYVDDSNTTAMRLYERSGFNRYDLDVQWERT